MKVLARNTIAVWYANPAGQTDTVDKYGNITGAPRIQYSAPIKARMAVGVRSGSIALTPHGLEGDYDLRLTTDDLGCDMDAGSVVWIGCEPVDADENPVPHTHVVTAVLPSFNYKAYRLAEVARP